MGILILFFVLIAFVVFISLIPVFPETFKKINRKVLWGGTICTGVVIVSAFFLSYFYEISHKDDIKGYEEELESSSFVLPTNPSTITLSSANGYDWVSMTSSEKQSLVQKAISNMESNGQAVNVSSGWFITNLDAFYGDDDTNSTKVTEAMAMTGAIGGVFE